MAYNERSKQYVYDYKAKNIKRVPLDLQLSDYEELKVAAESAGMSVNGFIKSAIRLAISAGAVQATPLGEFEGGIDSGLVPKSEKK